MSVPQPTLPYAFEALEPYISQRTLEYHYQKHHLGYFTKLNALIKDTPFTNCSLEEIVKLASGAIFNNAAQVWNHSFYWKVLTPDKSKRELTSTFQAAIIQSFGSIDALKEQFSQVALDTFGSGWAWLMKARDGKLNIISTSNAGSPLTMTQYTPLLTCDVWEHAYYLDYQNARAEYVNAFWKLVNWDFVSSQYAL